MMFCDTCQCDIVVAQGACPVCGRVLVKDEVAREAETVERTPQEEFDHGMNQIALGEFDHGIRHLKRSVERDPQNKAYARRTAELLFERKMYAESIPYFQRVVDIEPTRPRSHCMLGKAYKGNKQFAEARLCFEAALKLEPAFAIAKVELESLPVEHVAAGPAITSPCINHIDQRAITKCISCGHPLCSECAHDAPEDRRPLGADPTERLYLCEPCLRPKGAYVHGHSEATTFVDASVGAPFNPFGISHEEIRAATGASIEERIAAKKKTLDGTMHPCPVCQSDVFVTAGKCSVCGTLLVEDEVAGEGVQRTPEEEMQHGMDRLSVGDYEHALKHLRRASDRAPDNFKLASQAGTILFERKKYDEAVVYWARAAEVAERSPKAQFRYGRALQAAGKFGMAKKAYEKALELDPSYASAKAALIDLPEEGGPAEAEEVGTCAFHPLKVAMFACADCGKLLCASCVRAVPPGRKTKPMAPGETPYLCDTCLNPSDA
jgi:tetratricopeptide (TPR) repeat protein